MIKISGLTETVLEIILADGGTKVAIQGKKNNYVKSF
jgi:hypothetical protein